MRNEPNGRPKVPAKNAGTGSSVTLLRVAAKVSRASHSTDLVRTGLSPTEASTPHVRRLPPFRISVANPVDPARVRRSSRSLIHFWKPVNSIVAAWRGSSASKPASNSRCRSGLRSKAPTVPTGMRPGIPSALTVPSRGMNFWP